MLARHQRRQNGPMERPVVNIDFISAPPPKLRSQWLVHVSKLFFRYQDIHLPWTASLLIADGSRTGVKGAQAVLGSLPLEDGAGDGVGLPDAAGVLGGAGAGATVNKGNTGFVPALRSRGIGEADRPKDNYPQLDWVTRTVIHSP
jgi:hypothetical protein